MATLKTADLELVKKARNSVLYEVNRVCKS